MWTGQKYRPVRVKMTSLVRSEICTIQQNTHTQQHCNRSNKRAAETIDVRGEDSEDSEQENRGNCSWRAAQSGTDRVGYPHADVILFQSKMRPTCKAPKMLVCEYVPQRDTITFSFCTLPDRRMPHRNWIRGQHWTSWACAAQCCPLFYFQ